jgi:hypothetical protein
MNAFVDNTGIHRVFTLIRPQGRAKPIRKVDALALLQLAEHLLFSEEIRVSTFEWPQTCEITHQAIERLRATGCIDESESGISLQQVDFTETEYGEACKAAAPRIQEVLQTSDLSALGRASRLVGEATRPIKIASPMLGKWLERSVSKKHRESMLSRSSIKNAAGAFDFTICTDPSLYSQMRVTASKIKGAKQRHEIGAFLEVLFRVAINEQLARIKTSYYSPAPQRAKTVHMAAQVTEYAFRSALERVIDDEIRGRGAYFASKLLEAMHELKTLPFPMFVIHYLREARPRPKTPLGMLEAARKIRDNPEVREIRQWVNKWELISGAGDPKKREKAKKELDGFAKNLQFDRSNISLFSLWNPKLGTSETSWLEVDPDLKGGLEMLGHLFRRIPFFHSHSMFLATVSKEFELDPTIGRDINRMIGCATFD